MHLFFRYYRIHLALYKSSLPNINKLVLSSEPKTQCSYQILSTKNDSSIHRDSYSPGVVQAREMEWGPDTVTLWGGWIPVGQETGVCITYLSLTPVPPSVLASSSYIYLKRWQGKEGCGESSRQTAEKGHTEMRDQGRRKEYAERQC